MHRRVILRTGWRRMGIRVVAAATTLLLLAVAAQPAFAKQPGAGQDKVAVCHRPPGNPGNATTIVVGAPAVGAHLTHGDTLGECAPACAADGSACASGADCCSGFCDDDGACAVPCGADGSACGGGTDCCSGFCDGDGACGVPCGTDGSACGSGADCCSGLCEDGECAVPCGAEGSGCASGGDCCSGFCDEDGACASPCADTGTTCDGGGDCCSGICTDTSGTCADSCTLGPEFGETHCTRDLDCCEGQGVCIFSLCFSGFTCSMPGEACDPDAGQFCCFNDICLGGACLEP